MKVNLVAYGIAKDILNGSNLALDINENINVDGLKEVLIKNYPEFSKLQNIRFAVNEEYRDDSFLLTENDEVVIIPPVSGG